MFTICSQYVNDYFLFRIFFRGTIEKKQKIKLILRGKTLKTTKKIFVLILCMVLTVGMVAFLTACGGDKCECTGCEETDCKCKGTDCDDSDCKCACKKAATGDECTCDDCEVAGCKCKGTTCADDNCECACKEVAATGCGCEDCDDADCECVGEECDDDDCECACKAEDE